MKKSLPNDFEFFLPVELAYLNTIKNEDEFVKSWIRFKKNNQKSVITNLADARFYDDCEKFTKSIIQTRITNKELDQKLHDLTLSVEKSKKIGEKK